MMTTEKNEILLAHAIGRIEGELGCICPHCNRPVFLDETRLSEIRGEQFQHTGFINLRSRQRCNGWFEVAARASFDRAMFILPHGG